MASPRDPPTQTQPLTPPADPAPQATTTVTNTTTLPAPLAPSTHGPPPPHPSTSHADAGTSKRPRDARLIHLILASLGVAAYQERVPLQLLDFAYRYTSSVLGDAAHLQAEGYDISGSGEGGVGGVGGGGGKGRGGGAGKGGAGGGGGGAGGAGPAGEKDEVSLASLRMAIGSRMQYQYAGSLPKEFLMGLAKERNRVGLGVGRGLNVQDSAGQIVGGVKLPAEKYCLTGVGWGLREEWDSEGEEDMMTLPQQGNGMGMGIDGENGEEGMGMGEDDENEDGEATMEDIFGDDDDGAAAVGGGLGGQDEDMLDD